MTIEPTATPFGTLALTPAVLTNLAQFGYTDMTPIQATSLSITLAGHNLIAQAKTGSGKIATFTLALLAQLGARSFDMQTMVFYPARELADQAAQEIHRLTRTEENVEVLTPCGGALMRPQATSLEHGAHVIVDTPGRIMNHLERGNLGLGALKALMLGEAGRMLNAGFFDDIATAVH